MWKTTITLTADGKEITRAEGADVSLNTVLNALPDAAHDFVVKTVGQLLDEIRVAGTE